MAGRYCIFVSAGDRHKIDLWLKDAPNRKWNLIVAYYGDDDGEYVRLSAVAKRAFRQKGGKFQNLRDALASDPGLLDGYDYVWVCDDDMIIRPDQILLMFRLAEQFEFWVCQPALSTEGRISYKITAAHRTSPIRVVNFVETNFPLFRRDKLMAFMAEFDGSLTGYGVDWWFCNFFDGEYCGRLGIIDAVVVTNPHHEAKVGGDREIDRLQPAPGRKAAYEALRDRKGLKEYRHQNLWYCIPGD
jgi:hypothetical protein